MKTSILLIIALMLMTGSVYSQDNRASVALTSAIYEEEVSGNLDKAVVLYLDILKKYPDDRIVAAKTLYHLGLVNEKMGKQKAFEYFTELVNTYPDQKEIVALAKAKLANHAGSGVVNAGGLTARRILTDASGVYGALTPDGKYIRFLDRNTGDVIQLEVSSGQTSRIKNKGSFGDRETYVEGYVFSRDGKQIGYDRYTTEGKPQLRIRNIDGTDLRTVFDETSTMLYDWSPDSKNVLVLKGDVTDKTYQLGIISLADRSVKVLRKIESAPYMLTNAKFSPDGHTIAFSLVVDGNMPQGEIYIMTESGQNEVVVSGHPAEDELLTWTPDGKNLLFLSDRSGTWDIWIVRISDGKQQGEPELLKKDFGRGSKFLGFAPDGSLYYKTAAPLGNLYIGEVDIETGKLTLPAKSITIRFNGAPSRINWSPDGRYLLYISGGRALGNGNNNITIRSSETGEERFLLTPLRKIWDLYWAPDSRSILAWGMTVKENALFRIDIETSQITRLADGRWAPRISQDGKTMVYMGTGGITTRNLETGEESVGVKAGNEVLSTYLDLSPDLREAAFQENGTIYTVALGGGEPKKMFAGQSRFYTLRWTRDGRYIIAQGLDEKSGWFLPVSEIWKIPVNGDTPLKLDLAIPKLEFFTLHPDNRHFAYSINDGIKQELWVIQNLLPE